MYLLSKSFAILVCACSIQAGPIQRYSNGTSNELHTSSLYMTLHQISAAHEALSEAPSSTRPDHALLPPSTRKAGAPSTLDPCPSMSTSSFVTAPTLRGSTRGRGGAKHVLPSSNAADRTRTQVASSTNMLSAPVAHSINTASGSPGAHETRRLSHGEAATTTTLTLYTTVPSPVPLSSCTRALDSSKLPGPPVASSDSAESSVPRSSSSIAASSTLGSDETTKSKHRRPTKASPTRADASSTFAYPLPHTSEYDSSALATVDPIQTSFTAPSVTYSYNPEPDQTSKGLPPIVTQLPPSVQTSEAEPTSSPTAGPSTIAGITIVPLDPDATTIYITETTTTTDVGQTTTFARQTITMYA